MEARQAVFVDASGWIGLLLPRDENHRRARTLWAAMEKAKARLVTSNLVVAETHAFLLSRLGHAPAQRFLRAALEGDAGDVVWVDAELATEAAQGWIYRRPDRSFSLTDATSFEIMQRQQIADALSFDHDFIRAGFHHVK